VDAYAVFAFGLAQTGADRQGRGRLRRWLRTEVLLLRANDLSFGANICVLVPSWDNSIQIPLF
jgi:hypothetical protein